MWSGPRNISTALMRSFENRLDCFVSDEPFYSYFLHKTGLKHPLSDEIIKSGINGFMFKPNDLDGFSKAVLKILQNKSKRQAIVKRGLKTVNDYHNPMRMIKDFKKIYEQR